LQRRYFYNVHGSGVRARFYEDDPQAVFD